ncbi:hypothetical protein PHYBOEH_010138 [Phytophthora boehmeriae]|uniref:Uncharacterized protein n=1 Tax=Phytophthora boehmeriae TaxID=109152 RepID=A0A8T1X5N6_9STRA|nr:hypothetical protein PHYBOEH_010138 [Phytophthora boehmeriae]
MGNFLVASVCRARSRSEAVYTIVRAQVGALRGRQRRGSPLQRRCAAQQAALLRALSTRMALGAAVMSCWAAAATTRAKAALIASLVFIAKKFIASTKPQQQKLQPTEDVDDVFDEFNAVFEADPKPTRSLRRLTPSFRPETKSEKMQESGNQQSEDQQPEEREATSMEEDAGDTDSTNQLSDVEDDYEVLPKLEDDWAFYTEPDCDQREGEQNLQAEDNQLEGERLLQLASSISDTAMHVEDYILNGKHEKFDDIASDVDQHAVSASDSEKRSLVRVLLAYCAYSDDANYSSDMVVTADECLQVWQGDEDRAFKSLTVLCSDVPRLCAALN